MSKIAVELSAGERIPVVDFPGLEKSVKEFSSLLKK